MKDDLSKETICNKLLEIAKANGIVSADESNILDSVRMDIQKYYTVLDESYKDNIITADEQHQLYEIRKEILEDALKIAKSDSRITREEYNLLRAIRDIILDLEMNEDY